MFTNRIFTNYEPTKVEKEGADKDLLLEILHKSNAKAKFVPVIISTNESLSRSFQRRLGITVKVNSPAWN